MAYQIRGKTLKVKCLAAAIKWCFVATREEKLSVGCKTDNSCFSLWPQLWKQRDDMVTQSVNWLFFLCVGMSVGTPHGRRTRFQKNPSYLIDQAYNHCWYLHTLARLFIYTITIGSTIFQDQRRVSFSSWLHQNLGMCSRRGQECVWGYAWVVLRTDKNALFFSPFKTEQLHKQLVFNNTFCIHSIIPPLITLAWK